MKKFKRTFIATLICAQAILPLPYAAARTIPGVDEPFNPPLYYHPTAPDYEDDPSPFAIRDLSSNGTVIDITRLIRSQLFGDHFLSLLGLDNDEKIMNILNMLGIPTEIKLLTGSIFMDSVDSAIVSFSSSVNNGSYMFRNLGEKSYYDRTHKDMDFEKQAQYAEKQYQDVIKKNTQIMLKQHEDNNNVNDILNTSFNAEGEVQVSQLGNSLRAILTTVEAQKTAVLNNFIQVQAMEHMIYSDEKHAREEVTRNFRAGFMDQKNEQSEKVLKEQYNYERPKPVGMPDF